MFFSVRTLLMTCVFCTLLRMPCMVYSRIFSLPHSSPCSPACLHSHKRWRSAWHWIQLWGILGEAGELRDSIRKALTAISLLTQVLGYIWKHPLKFLVAWHSCLPWDNWEVDLGPLAKKKRFLPWSWVKKRGRSQRGGIISAFLPGEEEGRAFSTEGTAWAKTRIRKQAWPLGEQQVIWAAGVEDVLETWQ